MIPHGGPNPFLREKEQLREMQFRAIAGKAIAGPKRGWG